MTTRIQNSALTADPILMTVRARLGLIGVGRVVTILSLSGPAGASLGYAEWLGLLQATALDYDLMVAVLAELQVCTAHATDNPARIRFEPGPACSPAWADRPAHLTLMPDAAAWAAWCESELAMPGWMLAEHETQSLFRRWCASNVTVAEATQAVLQAAAEGSASPVAIHGHLTALRKQALLKAHQ